MTTSNQTRENELASTIRPKKIYATLQSYYDSPKLTHNLNKNCYIQHYSEKHPKSRGDRMPSIGNPALHEIIYKGTLKKA